MITRIPKRRKRETLVAWLERAAGEIASEGRWADACFLIDVKRHVESCRECHDTNCTCTKTCGKPMDQLHQARMEGRQP